MKKNKNKLILVALRSDQYEMLKEMNQITHIPVTEFVRQGVDLIIKEKYTHSKHKLTFKELS